MGLGASPWVVPASIVVPFLAFCTAVFILLLLVLAFTDSEAELKNRYQNDVVRCHPRKGKPPISYEEWKKLQ